jgi:hypothetical protein
MLDDFGNELENTDSKLDSTMKKVAKVLHMTNGKFTKACILYILIVNFRPELCKKKHDGNVRGVDTGLRFCSRQL